MRAKLFLLFPLISFSALSEEKPSFINKLLDKLGASEHVDTSKLIDWGVLPGPFVNPEQGLGLGIAAVGLYTPWDWQPNDPFSTVTVTSYVSTSGSYGFGFENRSYFQHDSWRLLLNGWISHEPGDYWGVGVHAAEQATNKTQYNAKRFQLNPIIAYEIYPHTYLKAGWQWQKYMALNIKSPTAVSTQLQDGTSSGFVLGFEYDSRDFEPNPERGSYLDLKWTNNREALGSSTNYQQWLVNFRHYRRISPNTIIAGEFFTQSFSGDVPWYDLALLGDDERMRGYYQGRYRDKNLIALQVEARHSFNARHGMVGWIGAGSVASNYLDAINQAWLPSVGVGYRFAFKARINVRIDLGIGKETTGFYFQINEAF